MTPEDVRVSLPVTWRRRSAPDHGVVVSARSTVTPASGVHPELTLRCAAVDTDLHAWRDQALAELATRLLDFDLEDADAFDLLGREVVYHRFAHRLGAADVLSDQWSWLHEGVGVVLTCSVAREDYPDYCDVFEAIAGSVDLGPARQSSPL